MQIVRRHVLPVASVVGIWALASWPAWAPCLIAFVHGGSLEPPFPLGS